MTAPILESTATGGTEPQATDLTVLDNLKQYLFSSDSAPAALDDGLLQRMISSASLAAQRYLGYDVATGKMLAATTYTEMLDSIYDGSGWPNEWLYQIPVSYPPIQSVSSVVIDGQTIPSGGDPNRTPGWFFDPLDAQFIYVAGYKPGLRAKKNVVVTYVGGYQAIPYDVEQAIIETVSVRYKEIQRIGLKSVSMAGESVSTESYVIAMLPPSAQTALKPYRRVVVT